METLEDRAAKHGKSLIINFYILVKVTGIYESMNETILTMASKLLADVKPFLFETGEFTIKVIESSFYLEGIRIKAGISDIESFTSLAEELKKRSVGQLDFKEPLSAEDLINLAYALKTGAEAADIQSALESKLTRGIIVGGPVFLQREEGIDLKDSQAMARRAYSKAVAAMKEMDKSLKGGIRLKLKKIKRALQLIVDCILTDESYLLRLTMAHNSEPYYYHPVNVAALSIALGKKIGLNRVQLRTLAMAAFLHDSGKTEIPLSILNKRNDFTPKEQALFERHPVDGIKVLLKSFGLNDILILSMLVSFEHHMKLDHSGYPASPDNRKLNLFSRIVSIADDYDSLVPESVLKNTKSGIKEAMKLMLSRSGTLYDPPLIRAFAGIFQ